MPTLRIKLADRGEITHELTADRITIGRRPDNTIQIMDRSVSANHAEFIAENGHYRLHDLGSTNRCFVEGEPVTDYHLLEDCKIMFGTVECFYDPDVGAMQPRLSHSQMEKDLTFLRGENTDLLGQISSLQRQVNILSSARLVTKRADNTPSAAANDTFKAIIAERDDLRHLTAGLKLELDRVRKDLAAAVQERDAARQTCELLQAGKAGAISELRRSQAMRAPGASNGAPSGGDSGSSIAAVVRAAAATLVVPGSAPKSSSSVYAKANAAQEAAAMGATQKISLPLPPAQQAVATPLKAVAWALSRLEANIHEKTAQQQLSTQGVKLAQAASAFGGHPVARLSLAIEGLLQECLGNQDVLELAQIQMLLQATELISCLLDPNQFDRAKSLPHPKILAVDDDSDVLYMLAACLELAQLPTTTCSDSNEAKALVGTEDYDLLLLDVGLPRINGITLCDCVREIERYRKTPIIFLADAHTLDDRSRASLSGGNDFLPKPFNTAELTVKAETWIWKNRFGLL